MNPPERVKIMLNLDPVVQVNVSVGAAVVTSNAYDTGLIVAPPSESFTTTQRAAVVTSLAEVVALGYADTTDTYKAAEKYFGVFPAPKNLIIGVVGTGETVTTALQAIRDVEPDWYGMFWVGASTQQILDIDEYLNTANQGIQFATMTGAVSTIANQDPLSTLATRETRRTMLLYSAVAIEGAAVMGEAMGCASEYSATTWQLCYKTIAGVAVANVTQTEVETLLAANLNVYVTRAYAHSVLERGATVGGLRVDEVIALDRMSNDIQEALFALIAQNPNKLPQNDTTTTQFISAVTEVLENYRTIGYVMEGIWRGEAVGNVAYGDALERGYSMWADSFDNQTDEDRKARKGMPIYVALILCGSVESVVLNVTVQE